MIEVGIDFPNANAIIIEKNNEIMTFNMKNKRKVDNKLINSLNLQENVIIE